MADEKKLKNEELTDEQVNEAAGGVGTPRYKCQGGCGMTYDGLAKFYVNYQPYCPSCYVKYQQAHEDPYGRPDHRERPDHR